MLVYCILVVPDIWLPFILQCYSGIQTKCKLAKHLIYGPVELAPYPFLLCVSSWYMMSVCLGIVCVCTMGSYACLFMCERVGVSRRHVDMCFLPWDCAAQSGSAWWSRRAHGEESARSWDGTFAELFKLINASENATSLRGAKCSLLILYFVEHLGVQRLIANRFEQDPTDLFTQLFTSESDPMSKQDFDNTKRDSIQARKVDGLGETELSNTSFIKAHKLLTTSLT